LVRYGLGGGVGNCDRRSLNGSFGLLRNDLVIVIALIVRYVDCWDSFGIQSNRDVLLYVPICPDIGLGGCLINLKELLELRVLREFRLLPLALQGILLQRRNVFVVLRGALLQPLLPSRLGKLFVGNLLTLRSRSRHSCRQVMLTGRAIST
jgi:hypothetical protein